MSTESNLYSTNSTEGVIPPKRFSEKHDVLHYMVPYEHFAYDPWDVLNELQSWLERQPDTRATWTWEDADTQSPCGCKPRWTTMCRLLGAWPLNSKNSGATVWVNPYYGQLDELNWEPDADKVVHIFNSGAIGTQTITKVASRFNNWRNAINEICQHRDMPWGELRRYGKRRVANTVVVTKGWTGRSIASCARALGMPARTLRGWIDKHATVSRDFERPAEKWAAL